jgi:hypothetical protein
MLHLELRLLGTQLLDLRLGRQDTGNHQWLAGYESGRWDHDSAEDEDDDEPSAWIGCQGPLFGFMPDAEAEDGDTDLNEEWATFLDEETTTDP